MLYLILERMIARGSIVGLQDKLDIFYAVGRLAETEYQTLTNLMTDDEPEAETTAEPETGAEPMAETETGTEAEA